MTTNAAVLNLASPLTELPIVPPTVEQLMAEVEALKNKLAQTGGPVVNVPVEMTLEEAQSFVAKFEGKRGRRPAEFYEAMKLIEASTPKPSKEEVKAAKKLARETAKMEAASQLAQKAKLRAAAKALTDADRVGKLVAKADAEVSRAQKRATKLNNKFAELTAKAAELNPVEE
jgi:methylphosphotriester-DNA--protein-cysteine methyltransferase